MHRPNPCLAVLAAGALLLTATVTACTDPGIVTDSFVPLGPDDVDMLWIIDNSASMDDAQAQLMSGFERFGNGLPDGSNTQMAVTTTQAWPCTEDNTSEGCDDVFGTTGMVRREGTAPYLLDPADADDRALLAELVDVGVHGAQKERPLQVTLMAFCEASALPAVSDFVPGVDDLKKDFPAGCSGEEWDTSHALYEPCHCLPAEVDLEIAYSVYTEPLRGANEGLLRHNAAHVVVVTDEGDDTSTVWNLLDSASCAKETTDDCACMHAEMLRLTRIVVPEVRFTVIGPGQGPDADEETRYACNPQENEPCLLDFNFWSVSETDGLFVPLRLPVEGEDSCTHNDFGTAMTELLLSHPSTEWLALSNPPDPATIEVELDDEFVPSLADGGSCTDAGTGGWSYDLARRAVALTGDCTPAPPDTVKVRYQVSEVEVD